eukprot:354041-Chlamydomonas_euryale.AAC.11
MAEEGVALTHEVASPMAITSNHVLRPLQGIECGAIVQRIMTCKTDVTCTPPRQGPPQRNV